MNTVLSTQHLHKQYGKITAINRLSLDIPRGSVYGLLGPNGSGKTTTLGMLLGVITPTEGSFRWFEQDDSYQHRKRVGAILEKPNFYPSFSGYHNLRLVCKIKEVEESRIDEVLGQVGLLERKDDRFKTYSLGMKQRLAIGSALLAKPEVLILDEPTNGLDPKGIADIRELITSIAQSGKTIILASHLLDEVQKVCSEFAVLDKGNLIYTGKVDADLGDEVLVEVAAHDRQALEAAVRNYDGYLSHKVLKNHLEISCRQHTDVASLNRYLGEAGIYPHHLVILKKNLEQQFMEILSRHA